MFASIIRHRLKIGVGLAALAVVLLPLNLLWLQPLHQDEALYATWARQITSGRDPWLTNTAIDKPPLYLYTVAGAMWLLGPTATAARLPSLAASAAMVLLTFWLGRRLYGEATGLLAAWLVALSPFVLMFAPTAFTDPLLVALLLAGGVSAAQRHPAWAGLWVGLAIATKPQGLFFVPLVAALLLIFDRPRQMALRFGPALVITLLPAFLWDMARRQPSGFLEASLAHYGGLSPDLPGFGRRWWGFIDLLAYGTASPLLNTIFLFGLPLLLLLGGWLAINRAQRRRAAIDRLLAGFSVGFLLLHAVFSFQVWDRYLLGVLPLLALLLARVLWLPWRLVRRRLAGLWRNIAATVAATALAVLLGVCLARPVQDAVNARFPLGSHSDALRGIEQITGYLQGQVGANSTLYHHWLGAHWRFYLWGYPYDLQYWDTAAALAARAKPGHLIAFPTRRSNTEARLALAHIGLHLTELTRAYAPDGSPSIILYRLDPDK